MKMESKVLEIKAWALQYGDVFYWDEHEYCCIGAEFAPFNGVTIKGQHNDRTIIKFTVPYSSTLNVYRHDATTD